MVSKTKIFEINKGIHCAVKCTHQWYVRLGLLLSAYEASHGIISWMGTVFRSTF